MPADGSNDKEDKMSNYESMARAMNNAYQGRTTSTFGHGEHVDRLFSFADNQEKPAAHGVMPQDKRVDDMVCRMYK